MFDVPTRWYALIALSLSGFFISVYQTHHFHHVRSGPGSFDSFCTFGSSFNCEAVELSSYSELIFGIPLSAFAAGWYLAFAIVLLVGRNAYWRRDVLRASLIFTGFGMLMSVVYFGIMVGVIKSLCLFCLIIDGINIASLGIVLSMKPESFRASDPKTKPEFAKFKTMGWITASALIVAIILSFNMDKLSGTSKDMEAAVARILNSQTVDIEIGDDDPSIGPKDAPITIVKFSDFQCPSCKFGALSLHPVLGLHKEKVRFVFKSYPLDAACNPNIQRRMHPVACKAAEITYCANEQGKFDSVYKRFFEKQSSLAKLDLIAEAGEAGADVNQLKQCVESGKGKSLVERSISQGDTAEVRSTPTFFLNGKRVTGALPPKIWLEMINQI